MYAVVYQQTNSALALVGLRLVHLSPELLFAAVAGVFVDRWSRKAILVVSPLLSAMIIAPLLAVHPAALIFVAELLLTLVTMFFDPAVSATVPNIVVPEDLSAANTLTQITATIGTLVGGLTGGILVSALGASIAFAFDIVSFLVIAALVSTVRVPVEAGRPSRASLERDLWEGMRYLRDRPLIAAVVTAGALFVLAPSSIFTVGIVFAQSALHAGAAGYGVLLAGLGTGSLLGALCMILTRTQQREDLLFAVAGIALGGAFALMGLSRSLALATGFYAVAGGMSVINGVAAVTLIQRLVPDQLRGRIFGVTSSLNHLAAFAGAVLIAGIVGVLGAGGVITASGAVAGCAGLCVLVVILCGKKE
jgi:MFS family permease